MTQPNTGTGRRFLGSPFDAAGVPLLHRMDHAAARTSEPLHDEGAKRWNVGRRLQDILGSRRLGGWVICCSMKDRGYRPRLAACVQYLRDTVEPDDLERSARGPERLPETP